jgi:hypothetical protein
MNDDDELPEWKILEFEDTIRRLANEGRLPTRERFEAVMAEVRRDVKGKLDAIRRTPRRSETRD